MSGSRHVGDFCGCLFVLHANLAVQFLCEEIERGSGKGWDGANGITGRVASAGSPIGAVVAEIPGYDEFVELVRVRDAIEHPTAARVHASTLQDWTEVPLAWMLSDRPAKAHDAFLPWFNAISAAWEKYREKHRGESRSATLEVERGLRSTRQFKKPPTS